MSTQIADNLNIPNDQWITASVWGYDSKAHFESGSNANLTVYSGYSSHNEYFNGNRSETLTANSAWSQVNGGVPFGSSYGNLAAVRHYSGGSSDVWNGYGGFASSYCGTESQSWNDPSIASYDARNLNGTRFTPHNPPGVPAPYPFSTTSKTFVMPPSLVEDAEAAAGQKQTWLEWAVDQGVGFIPVYGSARDAYRAYKEGDNLGLGLNVGMLGLELLTFGGASVAKGVVKSSFKAGKSAMGVIGKAFKSNVDDAVKLVGKNADNVGRGLIDNAAGTAKSRISWQYGNTNGSLGVTDKFGKITIQPGLTGQALNETVRHEGVHQFLSPRYGPFIETRANVGIWGYQNSHMTRYIEEAIAETVATRNLFKGLLFPIRGDYDLSVARILAESGAYMIVVVGSSYAVYSNSNE